MGAGVTARVDVADCIAWAEAYDGPPLLGGFALRPLESGIRLPVTRLAQGYQVRQSVGGPVVVKETERNDMMNLRPGRPAVLTNAPVASTRGPTLGLPVRAVPVNPATVDELGMQRAYPVLIPASPSAESTAAGPFHSARPALKHRSTTLTREGYAVALPCAVMRVLARAGTVTGASMRSATRPALKVFSAPLARISVHTCKYRPCVGSAQL